MRLLRTILLLAAVPALARAQQQTIDRRFALNADGDVRIYNLVGSVRVIGWDKDSLVVTATMPAGMRLFGGGSRTGVKFGIEGDQGSPAQSADFVVHAPARARIVVRGAATDVDVSAIAGALDVATTSGQVKVQGTPREVNTETMNGDVVIVASPAYLRSKTATGRITWTGSSDDVALATVSGRMAITGGTVTRGRFESIDGEIRFSGGVNKNAALVFDTHGGDVVLLLPKDADAHIEADAPSRDLLGVKSSRVAGARGVGYATLGKPGVSGPSIVVRSFKGRVTASIQ